MITTARLVLRPLRRDDTEAIHEALGDAEVLRYWSTPPHRSIDETQRWMEASVLGVETRGAIELAVEHAGAVIGRVGFWRPEEIGFFFVRRFWGQGFAREAVRASIDFAFASKTWEEIRADVDPRNLPSLRVLENLGFRQVGRAERTYFIDTEWADSVYLRLARP
jgi:RimJ/RimL family protein N-acetyltransferase